jgi:hypothetical protein
MLRIVMTGSATDGGEWQQSMPLNGVFEFTLMAGGYESQPQRKTQLDGFHYGNGSFRIWKKRRVRPVPHRVRPRREGVAASTEQSGK